MGPRVCQGKHAAGDSEVNIGKTKALDLCCMSCLENFHFFYVVVGCETWHVYKDGSGGTMAHVWSFTVAGGV